MEELFEYLKDENSLIFKWQELLGAVIGVLGTFLLAILGFVFSQRYQQRKERRRDIRQVEISLALALNEICDCERELRGFLERLNTAGLAALAATTPADFIVPTGAQGEVTSFDRTRAEWYYRHVESNWLSELYNQKLAAAYGHHYETRANRNALSRGLTVAKNFFGFKPDLAALDPDLVTLKEREQTSRSKQYEYGEELIKNKPVATGKGYTYESVEPLVQAYRHKLDRALVLRTIQERRDIQREAFGQLTGRESTMKNFFAWSRRNKWPIRVGAIAGYAVIGGVTGGVSAAFAGASYGGARLGRSVVGGIAGGWLGNRVGGEVVRRADEKFTALEKANVATLSATALREREAQFVTALSEQDAARRDQKIYAVTGAVLGGLSAHEIYEQSENLAQRQWFMWADNEPKGMTTEAPALMQQPESAAVPAYPEEMTVPPEMSDVRGEQYVGLPEVGTSESLPITGQEAVVPEAYGEVGPEVTVTPLPAPGAEATIDPTHEAAPAVTSTPLESVGAERLADYRHSMTLGESTVSEQLFAAWKAGELNHLPGVPDPGEISQQEFLDRMNRFIDMQSPNAMTADEIRSMGIESGDFHKMQLGAPYDAVPLLDKMFSSGSALGVSETAVVDSGTEAFVVPETAPGTRAVNYWDVMEGQVDGVRVPVVAEVAEAHRQELIDLVRDRLEADPRLLASAGFPEAGNLDLVRPGDIIHPDVLNEVATAIAEEKNWLTPSPETVDTAAEPVARTFETSGAGAVDRMEVAPPPRPDVPNYTGAGEAPVATPDAIAAERLAAMGDFEEVAAVREHVAAHYASVSSNVEGGVIDINTLMDKAVQTVEEKVLADTDFNDPANRAEFAELVKKEFEAEAITALYAAELEEINVDSEYVLSLTMQEAAAQIANAPERLRVLLSGMVNLNERLMPVGNNATIGELIAQFAESGWLEFEPEQMAITSRLIADRPVVQL